MDLGYFMESSILDIIIEKGLFCSHYLVRTPRGGLWGKPAGGSMLYIMLYCNMLRLLMFLLVTWTIPTVES